VSVFRCGLVTGGFEAIGYVDRDGLPDGTLNADTYVKAHPVSEIEGFICLESVFKAIAKYNGIEPSDADNRYQSFITTAKATFKEVMLNKEILNRAKKRAEIVLVALMNPIKPDSDLSKVRAAFEGATPTGGWQSALQTMFNDEEVRLKNSLAGPFQDFIRDFPAKSYYSVAADKLDMAPDAIVRVMRQALKISDKEAAENKKLAELRDALVSALEPSMWPRKV
jgi:hypothetical protein